MAEYKQAQIIDAPAEDVFAWVSNVKNLPKYLPAITEASMERSTVAHKPGERVHLETKTEDGGTLSQEGYFHVDHDDRKMEWGSEFDRDYSGWLVVSESAEARSEVTVGLSFGPRSSETVIEEVSPDEIHPLAEGLAAALESIRRQVEESAGKVNPPPFTLPPEGE